MFNVIKNIIINHTYTDLNKLLVKIKRVWIEDNLTEAEYNELISLALNNAPVKDYVVQEQIDQIWLAIHELEKKTNDININPDSDDNSGEQQIPSNIIPNFVQPTGAHDAYQIGDRVQYNGMVYESLINGNVWAPDVYPAGWSIIRD